MWAPGQRPVCELCPQEGVAAVSAGDAGSGWLGVGARWTRMNRTQIYYPLTVRPRTGDPLRSDFADEQAVAGAADILLPCRGVLNGGGFIANPTLHHVLVDLPLHGDEALTHPAADDGGAAALRGGERGVGWRVLAEEHRRLSGAGKRREALGFGGHTVRRRAGRHPAVPAAQSSIS